MKETKTTLVDSTQSCIPIKDIRDGIIITEDNRFVKIMEILPINFLLKSPAEQNEIAHEFNKLFKTGPANMQFKIVSRNANMEKHLNQLRKEVLAESSESCFQLGLEYLKMLKNAGAEDGVTRRFFLIFEYEYESGAIRKFTWGDVRGQLYTVASRLESILAACGNEVVSYTDSDTQTLEILYYILNSNGSAKTNFEKIEQELTKKYLEASDLPKEEWGLWQPYIPVKDYCAPQVIEFRASKYMVIDGKYYMFGYIPSGEYNSLVLTGWISPLFNSGEGYDVDIFFSRQPRDQVDFKVRQSLSINRASLEDTNDTQSGFDRLADTVQAAQYLKNGLANGEDFYFMSILVTVTGNSKREVEWKFNELQKFLHGRDVGLRLCRWEIEEAFKSVLPLCKVDSNIYKKAKRNVLTSGAASTYPFTSFEMVDEDGILLGRNLSNNSMAILNLFDTRIYKNSNLFICGTSGAGKTFTLELLSMRMRLKQSINPVIIIAPEKEHEFERVCIQMDGQFIRFGSGSPHCINVLDIFQTDDTASLYLDGGTIISSKLEEKVQNLKTFFKILIPDISIEERELLDEALMNAYALKGITKDNESLIDPENPEQYKEMPILKDVYEELLKLEGASRIAIIVRTLVYGSGSSFNGHTNVDLKNKFIVMGLEHLNDDLLGLGMFLAIDYAFSKIKEDRTKKKALFIDEFWRFCYVPVAAEYCMKIAKIIRAYGGSVCFATQQINDIFALENGKYGVGVINNCTTKIIMQIEREEAERVNSILKLTDTEKERLTKYKQGEALLVVNRNNVEIKFEANPREFDLITTDRAHLEKQLQDMMSEADLAARQIKRQREVDEIITPTQLPILHVDPLTDDEEWYGMEENEENKLNIDI